LWQAGALVALLLEAVEEQVALEQVQGWLLYLALRIQLPWAPAAQRKQTLVVQQIQELILQ
jgi:hypothetical protein